MERGMMMLLELEVTSKKIRPRSSLIACGRYMDQNYIWLTSNSKCRNKNNSIISWR
jgi:hypothetical protein